MCNKKFRKKNVGTWLNLNNLGHTNLTTERTIKMKKLQDKYNIKIYGLKKLAPNLEFRLKIISIIDNKLLKNRPLNKDEYNLLKKYFFCIQGNEILA